MHRGFIMVTLFVSSDVLLLSMDADDGPLSPAYVSRCLAGAGLEPWKHTEAELYRKGDKALVIARPAKPRSTAARSVPLRLQRQRT